MASRRRRRTDSDDSGATSGEAISSRPYNMKDESREDPAAAGPTPSISRHDRSLEFSAIVRSIVQSNQAAECRPLKPSDSLKTRRNEFTILTKNISRDLASVYNKLDKLTLLAKRKSIFDDKESEIDQLTFIIKQDLGLLNKQISQLQELSRVQKAMSGHDKQTHANSVLVTLQVLTNFLEMQDRVESKLAVMTSDFRSVLHVRTETLQQQQNRRRQFSSASANVSTSLPSSSSTSSSSNRWLLLDEANKDDVSIDMNNVQYNGPTMQQLQSTEDKFMQSRADTMKNIEQTIVELGSIYQQLAHMVQEQGEMVQRIDSNVDETQMNVELAHNEIIRYFQSISSNRWLMVKIFAVLIVFFIFFVVFIS